MGCLFLKKSQFCFKKRGKLTSLGVIIRSLWEVVGKLCQNNVYSFIEIKECLMDTVLNPTQLHLLKMFSFAKDSKSLEEIRVALTDVFAKRVENGMDALWDSGEWNNEKNEDVLNEHLRTPYKNI